MDDRPLSWPHQPDYRPITGERPMNIGLWVVQVLLAAAFVLAGAMKLTRPLKTLSVQMPWTTQVPSWLVRFIGLAELLGGLGLLLPAWTGIAPVLTPLAGVGLAFVM